MKGSQLGAYQSLDPRLASTSTVTLRTAWIVNLLSCTAVFLLMAWQPFSYSLAGHDGSYGLYTAIRSPWMGTIDRSFKPYTFLHMSLTNFTKYNANASSEVDEAWEALGVQNASVIVPESEGQNFGLNRNDHLFREDEGGYQVWIQALHQMHCVNFIREGLFYNVDYYRAKGQGRWRASSSQRKHLAHCVDELQQLVACLADTDIITSERDGTHWRPNFGATRQCRSYESVVDWARAHQPKNPGFI